MLFSDGCSAVRYAAANDKSLCIETLVKLKADVNIRSTDGKSPLDRAKEEGYTKCIAALEAAGAAGRRGGELVVGGGLLLRLRRRRRRRRLRLPARLGWRPSNTAPRAVK